MTVRESPIQFRPGPLAQEVDARGDNPNETARRDLERYYDLLRHELRSVVLTEPEALVVCDALNGARMDVAAARLVWAAVDDAIQHDSLGVKWAVDGTELVTKLRGLTTAQALALVDAVERWWGLSSPETQGLRDVGLIMEQQKRRP